jgi:hypothetical protein
MMQTKQNKKYLLLAILVCIFCFTNAQQDKNPPATNPQPENPEYKKPKKKFDASSAVLIAFDYDAQFPFGHVAQRFGFDNLFCAELLYKTKKNWLVGGNGGFIYGSDSKQNYVFSKIATSTGMFITQYNDLTSIKPEEHGFNVQFTFGKIIPLVEKFPDAGLLFMGGFGAISDRIAVSVKAAELPQLSPEYRKGYDRMCAGPVGSVFLGGTYMGRRKYLNCYGGFQADLSYTINERPYDFYTMGKLNDKGTDLFLGIKIGWIIPVFLQTSEKEFFYY